MTGQALRWLGRGSSLLLFVAAWETACRAGMATPAVLPAPSAVAIRLFELARDPTFLLDLAATLLRLGGGLALAVAVGLCLGVAAARHHLSAALIGPLVRVVAPVPKIALYPALILLLGFDHASKIALVVADAFFPLFFAAHHGASTVDKKLLWSAQASGTPPWRCIVTVVIPAALPSIFTGLRISVVIACVVVFLSEMLSSSDGLGHVMMVAARSFRIVDMFAPVIVISAIGLLCDMMIEVLRKRMHAEWSDA